MAFIIQSTKTVNGKTEKDFFQECIGIMKVFVESENDALHYPTKLDAENGMRKLFGNRPQYKVISHEAGTNNDSPGIVRHGHDSGIF